jgi:hypothetical protein
MNDTPVKVGGIYKLRPDYDSTFFRFDHNEKYVMVLSEDYSGMHPSFNVLVYYKEGPLKTAVRSWKFRSFERWELIQ